MTAARTPQLEAALESASEEHSLAPWYRDCVRPLLTMPRTQWPRCCGRGCEPCADTLVVVTEIAPALRGGAAIATRVQALLGQG